MRPKWARKRILIPAALMLFFIGVVAGSGGETTSDTAASTQAAPAATATATVTATPAPAATQTVTAEPEPAPTVTKTRTIRVTVAPAADGDDSSGGSGGAASYANCSEVRDAGADPIRTGDAGYGRHLDRDGDGVACE
ncbi:excalibur calcium-binding domain-containing protein [Streptomyces sp. t39]|uniref:excalibur calcium-binding domain-containing protein n=1 Tax=Streptomyces sp. t39 TaxID=1828156 RepID=UPI002905C32B|nr:excalibur calcium-binding domain-containing protein [Streptomyces sp. t39]